MSALLQVDKLAKRFGGIVATDDVAFEVPEGELHAVIGPNGAGKTTLIAQLSGQLARRLRHASASPAPTSRGCRPGAAAISGSPARSRSRRCFSISPCSTMSRSRCRRMPGTHSIFGAMRVRRLGCANRRAPRWSRSALPIAPRRAPRCSATASIVCSSSPWRSLARRVCCCSTSPWPVLVPTNPRAWSRCLPA